MNAAGAAAFNLQLTIDWRIRCQQNLSVWRIAIVAITGSTKWSRVRRQVDRIAAATPGSYSEVEIPFD